MTDEPTSTWCINCEHFMGCRHLRTKKGVFLPENVITEETQAVCPDFSPAGVSEMKVRGEFMGMAAEGLVSLRALYYRSEPSVEDQEEVEEEDMNEDVPDFEAMLYGDDDILIGLTETEREDQLRYLTNADGTLALDEDENKVPRGAFPVRKYAEDPEGPVAPKIAEELGLELDQVPGVVRFWKTSELVPAVLRSEYDTGLIIAKSGKGKGKKQTAPAKAKATSTKTKKDVQMAPRKKILINRTGKSKGGEPSGPSGPKKKGPVSNKKKKTTSKKAPSKAKGGGEEGSSESGGGEVDLSEVLGLLQDIGKKQAAQDTAIEEMKDYLDQQVQTCVTLAHDAFMQKINEVGGGIGLAFAAIDEKASGAFWESEAVPFDNEDALQPDQQNLMSGPDGEQHSILLYLEQTEEGGDEQGEAGGDEE